MKAKTFEDYLQEQCHEDGGYDGVLDDDYEDAFNNWLEGKDVNDMIQYAEHAVHEARMDGLERASKIITSK